MIKSLIVFLAVVAIVTASSCGYGYDENRDGLNDMYVTLLGTFGHTIATAED